MDVCSFLWQVVLTFCERRFISLLSVLFCQQPVVCVFLITYLSVWCETLYIFVCVSNNRLLLCDSIVSFCVSVCVKRVRLCVHNIEICSFELFAFATKCVKLSKSFLFFCLMLCVCGWFLLGVLYVCV